MGPLNSNDLTAGHFGGRWEYRVGNLEIVFDHLAPSTRGLDAWTEVRWWNGERPKMLHTGRMDLMGSRTASALVRSITDEVKQSHDWKDIVVTALLNTIQDHLEGAPLMPLTITPKEKMPPKWVLYPLVGATGATSLIAPGGSSKSFVALAAAASVATNRSGFLQMKPRIHGPVVYMDWEADRDTHAERLAALCAGRKIDPPDPDMLLYRGKERATLARVVHSLEKQIARAGAVLVVIDSVMLARGGDAWGPSDTVAFYGALSQLGVPALLVDHKSREAIRKGWSGSYGSVVNDNSARLQWEYTSIMPYGAERLVFQMEATKRNNVGPLPRLGFDVRFYNDDDGEHLDAMTISQVDPHKLVELLGSPDNSQADDVLGLLRVAGEDGMLVKDIADQLGIADNQVRRILGQLRQEKKVEDRAVGRANRWYASGRDEQGQMPDPI